MQFSTDRETLELLAATESFNKFFSPFGLRLFAPVVFIYETVPLVFTANIASVADCLKHFFSFLWVNVTFALHVWIVTYFLQFLSETRPLNFISENFPVPVEASEKYGSPYFLLVQKSSLYILLKIASLLATSLIY